MWQYEELHSNQIFVSLEENTSHNTLFTEIDLKYSQKHLLEPLGSVATAPLNAGSYTFQQWKF